MSKIGELISELCPDGVEFVILSDVCDFLNGKAHEGDIDNNGHYIIVNSKFISTNGDIKKFTNKQICPIFKENILMVMSDLPNGRALGKCFIVDEDDVYTLNQRICALSVKNSSEVNFKFLYYILNRNKQLLKYDNGVDQTNLKRDQILNITIPLPPIEVQREIVRILDNFTELTAKLTAELQKRKEQYRHYSTVLFDDAKKSGVHSIEEVCHIEKGKTPIQKAIPGGYPMVVTTTERKSCDTYQFDAKAVCVPLVSSRGHGVASLNHVYYQEGKFALGNILCAMIPKNEEQVYPKYLYYYFEQTKDYTLVPLMKGGANVALHMNDVKKVKVPIPSLEEQKRIVKILDRFDTLCNDISTGLPAEIEARTKQYEYYRDKLLTFKELS